MDKSKLIWRVTENNVDGCGGTATEFVLFDTEMSDRYGLFLDCLSRARKEAIQDGSGDYETSDIINDALAAFETKTGIHGAICEPPYAGGFDF